LLFQCPRKVPEQGIDGLGGERGAEAP